MTLIHRAAIILLALAMSASAQKTRAKQAASDSPKPPAVAGNNAAAEDISGMYSFLQDGEFVQINLDRAGVSGYVSRMGTLESDRGAFLDQFFSKAAVEGHNVSFTTKPVHGVWFEFKGRFDRGTAKTRADDGYYVIRGTLTEYTMDAAKKNTSSRAREVEFKSMAQPEEGENSN